MYPTLAEMHASGHKGSGCYPALDCPKHLAPIVAIRQWLWQAVA